MKDKLSNIDVFYIVRELQKYLSCRVNNIYEQNSKSFILKLDYEKTKEKIFLQLYSGFRLSLLPKKPEDCILIPKSFCAKLRKHVKNKRVVSIKQLGFDRIIDFQFGDEDFAYHIILEIYARGNIILTDHQYNILHLLRRYDDQDNLKIAVNHIYPWQNFDHYNYLKTEPSDLYQWIITEREKLEGNKKINLKQFLIRGNSPISSIGPIIITHCLLQAGTNPNTKVKKGKENITLQMIQDFWLKIQQFFENNIFHQLSQTNQGFILLDKDKKYKEYLAFLFLQYQEKEKIVFNSFLEAITHYYQTSIEEKNTSQKNEKITKKINKVERVKQDISGRLEKFSKKIDFNQKNADWITNNTQLIDNLISKINLEIEHGNREKEITEKHSQVSKVNLLDKKITLDNGVSLDLNLNAYQNVTNLYTDKKKCQAKKKKTEIEGEKALQRVIKRNKTEDTKKKNAFSCKIEEKEYWFQQFHWCFTPNKLLFICGKTAEQNDMVVKRYMNKHDLYVHGDFHGSPSGVIQNPDKVEIPIKDIICAGNFLICKSKCWKNSSFQNIYYVNPEQVSKTAPSGEYMGTGSFMIRGKKNFLSRPTFELGLGLLFVDNHLSGPEHHLYQKFVENPQKEQETTYCVPVCAPYSSLANYKYKIKIKPGKQKLNKITKTIISTFCKEKKATPREKYLIKHMSNAKLQSVLVSNMMLCLSFNKK